MAITSENIIDKIEIVGPFKMVQVREAKVIKEDDVEIARNFHRRCICPSDDISGESSEIQGICATVHTDEVKAAFTASQETASV